ncbi:Gamma-butyrobetaine dioxygenase [Chionoecetes opilio]|uniref:Gamma-butyrobetaine dioxygenase n=1 Tax=Chionoecetes opilio TaxID=41210 RepID=A0A8J4XTL3_CHIOP|nr:Gamma-butyrobetaine dioxygenase [Chionoecetes opilio]
MSVRWSAVLLRRAVTPLIQPSRTVYNRGKSTLVAASLKADTTSRAAAITSALPAHHLSAKVLFENDTVADFKYIWLRDNCQCPLCIDSSTKQRLVDPTLLDLNVKPESLIINSEGQLEITWAEKNGSHKSLYDSQWYVFRSQFGLLKYGQSFMHNNFESDNKDVDVMSLRPDIELWDRTTIWSDFPELSYVEMMESDHALRQWLEIFYKYGVAVLRGVPTEKNKITEVVNRFAYVKETQYGRTFDVINKPVEGSHLAYTGVALAHHTDMNYREKSPGMQLLHCIKANDPKLSGVDPGGRSFFADGFHVASWLEQNEPAAFHVLTSTPVRFSIKNEGQQYSSVWPILCTNSDGDMTEVHYNNRTMKPLQAPTHVVTPFYHAYKLYTDKLREPSSSLEFNMVPGDLVAFNNHRVLHGRTAFDTAKVDSNINKKIDGLQDQVKKQAEVIVKQQRYLETLDRRDREKNIVVTGVPGENEALEGATAEEGKLQKIWASVEAGDEIKGHRRLGMKVDNKRRPILVTVDSKEARDRILEKTNKLKQAGGEFSRIYIKKDVHPSIRAEWWRLRQVEKKEKERPENSGCVIRLDTRERKLYRDNVVIDEWKQQFF